MSEHIDPSDLHRMLLNHLGPPPTVTVNVYINGRLAQRITSDEHAIDLDGIHAESIIVGASCVAGETTEYNVFVLGPQEEFAKSGRICERG